MRTALSQRTHRRRWHAGRVSTPSAPPKVLVVDDEPSITDAVATALRYEGFDAREVASGRAAEREIDEFKPDLIVLDVMLPDLDGLEIGRRLRDGGHRTPVIFLTAKDAMEDKVAGLAIGDDYVTKPFSLAEIVARVRAVLRRTRGEDDGELTFADVVMNEETREVTRAGTPVELTPTEFNLLRFLMLNPRRVLTKRQILDNVWHYDFGGDTNVLETYVSYLRKKLDPLGPPLIHTVRLVGYALREPGRR
jgi:two-component system OmpR family response regulator